MTRKYPSALERRGLESRGEKLAPQSVSPVLSPPPHAGCFSKSMARAGGEGTQSSGVSLLKQKRLPPAPPLNQTWRSATFATVSTATNLAWRPRTRNEATSSGRPPGLVCVGLWFSCGRRGGRLRRSSSRFCCGFGPCGSRLGVVLLETAMFVFTARAAMTGLVAPRSCTGRSSH